MKIGRRKAGVEEPDELIYFAQAAGTKKIRGTDGKGATRAKKE